MLWWFVFGSCVCFCLLFCLSDMRQIWDAHLSTGANQTNRMNSKLVCRMCVFGTLHTHTHKHRGERESKMNGQECQVGFICCNVHMMNLLTNIVTNSNSQQQTLFGTESEQPNDTRKNKIECNLNALLQHNNNNNITSNIRMEMETNS